MKKLKTKWLTVNEIFVGYFLILFLLFSHRPSILNVYFEEPDQTGHRVGPDTSEVRK